ncbi:MAG TPA: hypothetical protein HPP81_11565 [Deltaproteobacteria bacterium]|nr:hypothetical protein [Deltaproteobacteria bacterium]
MAEWRQLSTLTKIFYLGGLVSFIGLAVMIFGGMAGIGGIPTWEREFMKRCPWCM